MRAEGETSKVYIPEINVICLYNLHPLNFSKIASRCTMTSIISQIKSSPGPSHFAAQKRHALNACRAKIAWEQIYLAYKAHWFVVDQ